MSKKHFSYLIGIIFAVALLVGVCLLFVSDTVSLVSAIVIICLSLASGIMAPNPISLWVLIAGVCMLIFPAPIVGIVLIVLGCAGTLANLLIAKKKLGL